MDQNQNVTTIMADTLPIQLDLMQRGYVDALVGQLPYSMGFQAALTAVEVLDKVGQGVLSWPTETILGTHQLEVLRVPAGQSESSSSSELIDLEGQGMEIQERFIGLSISFAGGKEMSLWETLAFENTIDGWFLSFFKEQGVSATGAGDFETRVTVTQQNVTDAGNIITFDQAITFIALDGALEPSDYVTMPFLNVKENRNLASSLIGSIDAFKDVQAPIPRPVFPIKETTTCSSEEDGSFPTVIAATFAAAGAVGALIVAVSVYKLCSCSPNKLKVIRKQEESMDDNLQATDQSDNAESGNSSLLSSDQPTSSTVQAVAAIDLPSFKDQVQTNVSDREYVAQINRRLPRRPTGKELPVADAQLLGKISC